MNNNDKCRSNNNSNNVILHGHYRFLQALHESLLHYSHYCTNITKQCQNNIFETFLCSCVIFFLHLSLNV